MISKQLLNTLKIYSIKMMQSEFCISLQQDTITNKFINKQMKKSFFCLMAVAAIMLAGCSKEEFSEDPTPAPVPGIVEGMEHLGRGYDASQHYAFEKDIKAAVLDLKSLSGCIDTQKPLFTQNYTTYGSDLTKYVNNLVQKMCNEWQRMGVHCLSKRVLY